MRRLSRIIIWPGVLERNLPTVFLRERVAFGIWSSFQGSGKFFDDAIMNWSLGGSKGMAWITRFLKSSSSVSELVSSSSHTFGVSRIEVVSGEAL